jgi:hypothetical protein
MPNDIYDTVQGRGRAEERQVGTYRDLFFI